MILGISEDFTSKVVLDSQLKSIPSSGLYLNSGVHSSITLDNLLSFLPKLNFTFSAYDNQKTYSVFLDSMNREDIVEHDGKVYQSIQASSSADAKTPGVDTAYWLETNIESLRLKIFIEKVKQRVYSDLALTRRLINSQILSSDGENKRTLPNDYMGWVIEPKGSDYVSIRVNSMAIKKDGTAPVDVYVLNQGELIETIQLTPDNGRLTFRDTDLTFSGRGPFKLVVDSTETYVKPNTINPLKFNGFVAYTTIGDGADPASADYTYNTFDNGISIDVSVSLEPSNYIEKNLVNLSSYLRATFEYMVFETYLHNPNGRSNRDQRLQMNNDLLIAELKNTTADTTVVSRYHREKSRAIRAMEKTFDTQLNDTGKFRVKTSSF